MTSPHQRTQPHFRHVLLNLFGHVFQLMHERRIAHNLEDMSDRTLQDIGLSRGNIRYAVRHGRSEFR